MYEQHFGLSGPPFQLNPDPTFYFDSRGHSNALSYLKFGVHQGEGFIVVTGEIGAGKTTLVRTLLEGLGANNVVAAQVVSTQLESGDLLRAILAAFGVPTKGDSKAYLIASLEGFLTALAAKGQRALLIVDEAQNLKHEAVEELRMLSNFQLGTHSLLQSFLIGQPELRALLQSKSMEQLRQRVIASCHLGPLDRQETRAYIEHRLHRVHWKDSPSFADEAFEEIHVWTGGVPRRINRLCNRLFLAIYLTGGNEISASMVEQTATELRSEIGDVADIPLVAASISAPVVVPQELPQAPNPAIHRASRRGRSGMEIVRKARGRGLLHRPIMCLVERRTDYLKAGALARVLEEDPELPRVMIVHTGNEDDFWVGSEGMQILPLPFVDVHLGIESNDFCEATVDAVMRFDEVLAEYAPSLVLSMGKSDAVLNCALLAHKRKLPLLRMDAGERNPAGEARREMNGVLLDRLAATVYTNQLLTYYTLYREGIPSDRVQCVGSLVADLLQYGLPHRVAPFETLVRADLLPDCLNHHHGFGLVTLDRRSQPLSEWANLLCDLQVELPLLWSLTEKEVAAFNMSGQDQLLSEAGVTLIPAQGYLEDLGLLKQARCLITDVNGELLEEAMALGIRSIMVGNDVSVSIIADQSNRVVGRTAQQLASAVRDFLSAEREPVEIPEYWDGGTATRIAAHLSGWLPRVPHGVSERRLEVER